MRQLLQHKIEHHKKLIGTALLLGLVTTMILQTTLLAQQCQGIRDNVFRLHILANSDSPADQQLKLNVRDALLAQGSELLSCAKNKEEAITLARQQLPALQAIARESLKEQGSSLPVSVQVTDTYFNTRQYDTVTLPAGTYTALQVVIGEGAGKNWWCVMFPNLCLPAATKDSTIPTLEETLTEGQVRLVEEEQQVQIKFKAVELVQSALQKYKEWK